MKRGFASVCCMLGIVFFAAAPGNAGKIGLVEDSLDNLLGSAYSAVDPMMTTNMAAGNLAANVYSQAFVNGDGLYSYLYQVDNVGAAGFSAVELYTIGQFAGTVDFMGFLSGTLPAGFLAGGLSPEMEGYVDPLPNGLEISFYYTKREEAQIPVGQHSRVMYVLSELPPGEVVGSVINGECASGMVVGALPEPGTFALLAFAGLTVLAAVWFQKK